MQFDIITIFPEAFESYLNTSILKRAQARRLISIHLHNLRQWGKGRHRQLDDRPYGGGAGMVLMAEPILKAHDSIRRQLKRRQLKTKLVIFSAKGKQFNQRLAYSWVRKYSHFIFISGRYEGIDERVRQTLKAEEISIGPYVLTDGDVASMVVISALIRLTPGVIRSESLQEESFWDFLLRRGAKVPLGRALEYPHFTRPEVFTWKGKKYRVPKVLLSGDHRKIGEWRRKHKKG